MRQKGPQRLNEFPSHMGGDTCVYGRYVWEYAPLHPLRNFWGWAAQHRLVAETVLGRPLVQSKRESVAEVVHHLNHDPLDNRPENLEVLTHTAHRRLHARINADALLARVTETGAREALIGRTIREAAGHLGTTHMTLRRRFPQLVADRKRRAPADVDDPKWPEIIRPLAADPAVSIKKAVAMLNISAVPIRRICAKHGIVWMQNVSRKAGGYGRPKGSKVLDITDPKWPALVRPLADDPTCTVAQAARALGVGESQLRNIRAFHGIQWSVDAGHKVRQRSRGLATPAGSAADAPQIEPAQPVPPWVVQHVP